MKHLSKHIRPFARRTLLIAAPVAAVVLAASCGSEKRQNADSDSMPAAEKNSIDSFTSPDLGLWHLHGHVSGAAFLSYEVKDESAMPAPDAVAALDSITFDTRGLLTSLASGSIEKGETYLDSELLLTYSDSGEFQSGTDKAAAARGNKLVIKLSRTSGGYLQVIQALGTDRELSNPDTFVRLLEWTDGTLYSDETEYSGEGTQHVTYSYNDDGLPDKIVSKIADMSGDVSVEEEYTYTQFDSNGNWTERRVKCSSEITDGEADGTNMKTSRTVTNRVDRRRIYYYPADAVGSK